MSAPNQFALLRLRRFLPLFLTQFGGALNDNLFKNALVILIAFQVAGLSSADTHTLVNGAAALFILPFLLGSATCGQLADKYDKATLSRWVKGFEIGIMAVGAYALIRHQIGLLFVVLFLMGCHSTLFGPVKYAILPQHLEPAELVGGNGLVEMGTFVAILVGTMVAGALIADRALGTWTIGALMMGVALAGYAASRYIPSAPPADPNLRINWNPFTETWRNVRQARGDRTVFSAVLGNSWFWFFGATFLTQFPNYARDVLGGDETVVTLLLTLLSLGVGVGSLLCEGLSARRVEPGLIPLGALGMTLFALDLSWAHLPHVPGATLTAAAMLADVHQWRLLADLFAVGVSCGFYIVPLFALIQSRSESGRRARVIGTVNILNALFMIASAAYAVTAFAAGVDIPGLFRLTALLNVVAAILLCWRVPEFPRRFLVWARLRPPSPR